ncbi:hypothetical protein [Chryseobacterium cheonjiense]|uniref:Uncharacterized protein n=1 Tax=Chryseobacterium cheonjiense TaxID=2728845 RepID=A0A7Y0FI30_9FLAO|nr:hypothetical protein [Chryseobacterium cheonjiense]NML56755.1 hypothetical protein [Chryseobacterium cheonjiense]
MSKFLLFCKKTRVFLKYKFYLYQLRLLKFLGKFIPYLKKMGYTKDQILDRFNNAIIPRINNYSENNFNTDYSDFKRFDYIEKSCDVIYRVKYKKTIEFNILLIIEHEELSFGLINKNKNYEIYELYHYLNNMNDTDKSFLIALMNHIKE